MKRDEETLDDGRRRPAYPSLLDLALRTGRWTLATTGAAAVIAAGGAGCMGAAPADYEPVADPGGTIADVVVDVDAAVAPDEAAEIPVPIETAGIAPDISFDLEDATTDPDEGSMPDLVMAGMDVGPMPDVALDVEDVLPVPDVPDASYPELAGADPGSTPDVPAVPDAVDEVAQPE